MIESRPGELPGDNVPAEIRLPVKVPLPPSVPVFVSPPPALKLPFTFSVPLLAKVELVAKLLPAPTISVPAFVIAALVLKARPPSRLNDPVLLVRLLSPLNNEPAPVSTTVAAFCVMGASVLRISRAPSVTRQVPSVNCPLGSPTTVRRKPELTSTVP